MTIFSINRSEFSDESNGSVVYSEIIRKKPPTSHETTTTKAIIDKAKSTAEIHQQADGNTSTVTFDLCLCFYSRLLLLEEFLFSRIFSLLPMHILPRMMLPFLVWIAVMLRPALLMTTCVLLSKWQVLVGSNSLFFVRFLLSLILKWITALGKLLLLRINLPSSSSLFSFISLESTLYTSDVALVLSSFVRSTWLL